jgi:hypothetical protein
LVLVEGYPTDWLTSAQVKSEHRQSSMPRLLCLPKRTFGYHTPEPCR